ncbi:DnaJ domain-containing protein [Trichothermofontia sichuanensis]|uniref:DnaJ domain-containing protein n=1 Tax=Trichothermofontia sichuanensis TaxID=3045816 RepID=UPI00249F2D7F|nr:DnaJ domain-containing protein [Trichothermofontia sichuanensis]
MLTAQIRSYYAVLELQPGASLSEIKHAYRRLVRTWHPDRFPHDAVLQKQAEAKLKVINAAYEQLRTYHLPEPEATIPDPTHTQVTTQAGGAEAWYQRGVVLVKAGRYEEALAALSAAIRLDPNYARAYTFRGFIHSMLGFELGATEDFQKAQQLAKQAGKTTANPGWAKSKASKPQRSRNPAPPDTSAQAQTRPSPPTSPPPPPAPPPSVWRNVQTLLGHRDRIAAIALSPNGKILASGSWDTQVYLWNLQTGQPFFTLAGHSDQVWSVAFSPDGQILASAGKDGTIKLWYVRDSSLIRTLTGHNSSIQTLAISPDCKVLISGDAEGKVCFWNLSAGKRIRMAKSHQGPVGAVAISPDKQVAYSGGEDALIGIYHWRTSEPLHLPIAQDQPIASLVASADGYYLATGDRTGQIHLWSNVVVPSPQPQQTLHGHRQPIRTLAFSPKHTLLASGSEDYTVKLWHLKTGQAVNTLTGHTDVVTALAFSPDGKTLLSSSFDQTIQVWRLHKD